MIRELILFLIAATSLRRTCSHERCGCGEYVHAQREILRHIQRDASVSELIEARRLHIVDRIDYLQEYLITEFAGGRQ